LLYCRTAIPTLQEAENERMHLLTFMYIRQPGPFFRFMVLLAQVRWECAPGQGLTGHPGWRSGCFAFLCLCTLLDA
jgi:hypothetical protein